jgi:hypothetical protein
MNGGSQDTVGIERMLDDHHQINDTTLAPNSNFTLEIENFNVTTYLATILGPQRQPNEKLIPLTITYVAMAITGIIGNLSVCCVILRIPYMRSATNYYLFSLAVSDLLILLLVLHINVDDV